MTDKKAFKIVLLAAKASTIGKSKKGKQAIEVVREYLQPHAWWQANEWRGPDDDKNLLKD